MDGDGSGRNRDATEAARQYAAFAAAAMPPTAQQAAFYPPTAGVPHSWPSAFSADPAVAAAWFAHFAALAAAAQGGGGGGLPHALPFTTAAAALQQLPNSTAAASLPQLPSGGLAPFDRYQPSRSWLPHLPQPGSSWPMMLPSQQLSLMMPGSAHWSLYRHGLASAVNSPFSFGGASPSDDYRAGPRPPAAAAAGSSSSSAAGGERAANVDDQPAQQEPLLLGSSRHTYRTAGLHAFLPYSRSRTTSPLAGPASADTCLDLSMPRPPSSAGERGRAAAAPPPLAAPARGAPSPPAPTEATASFSAPASAATTAVAAAGSAAGCSRTAPTTKAERETGKRSSIPVGIAVAWQRRQDTTADPASTAPRADASGQQPTPTVRNKADLPGTGDEPSATDQPGYLKANTIAVESSSSPVLYKPAPASLPAVPSVVHFGLPLSLALSTESVIKANRSATAAKDLPRELAHDLLPQLQQHQPSGQSIVVKDAAVPLTQPLAIEIPKISVSRNDSGVTVTLKTEDSTAAQATRPREKPGVAMQRACEPTAARRGVSLIASSSIARNAAASGLGAERPFTGNAGSRQASMDEVAPADERGPGSTPQREDDDDASPSHHSNSEVTAVGGDRGLPDENEESEGTVLETGGRVLRAARRGAAKDGNAAAAKQAASVSGAAPAASESASRSKQKSGGSRSKAPKKKVAKTSASDELDYTVITYNGVKYHTLKDRELQILYKRLKERQRTLARSVRSYAGKIAKLDLMDDFEAPAAENDGHDNDSQPSAGPSISSGVGGTAQVAGDDGSADPAVPAAAAAVAEQTQAACGAAAACDVSGSCSHVGSKKKKKKDSKKKKRSSDSRKGADAHSPVAATGTTSILAAATDDQVEVTSGCGASASARGTAPVAAVTAAAVAAAAATAATVPADLRVLADDLVEDARLLVFIRGLPHEATVVCIEPPSVYGVLLVGQRSARPRVYARDDLLRDAYRDVQPSGVDALRPGSRVCAYWSNQFGYLYPGVVTAIYNPEVAAASSFSGAATAATPGGGGQSSRSSRASVGSRSHAAGSSSLAGGAGLSPLVDITFDDGDSGKFPLEQIRLLPPDFPHTPVPHQQGYDDELSVVPVERRRSLSRATSTTTTTTTTAAAASPVAPPSSAAAVRSPTGGGDGLSPTTKRECGGGGVAGRRQPACSVSSVCTGGGAAGGAKADDGDVFEDSDDEPLQLYKAKRARESFFACDGEWEWSGPVVRRCESSGGGGQGRQRHREIKDFYKEIRRGDETLKVGECAVFVRREEDKPPYVGKILSMWQGRRSHRMVVKVQWFYHPEEIQDIAVRAASTDGGIKDLTGALFESEHVDENSVQTISHRCEVLALADYQKEGLHLRPHAELMQHTAFYVAGKYDAAHSQVVSFLNAPGAAAVGN